MSGNGEDGAAPNLEALKNLVGKKDFKMPKLDDLLKVLDKMDLPEEQKEKLRENLMSNKFTPRAIYTSYVIFFATLAIVLLIFVFIGRKLYRVLTAKEKRMAEKKKLKEEKKSKQKDESKKSKKEEGDKNKKKKKN